MPFSFPSDKADFTAPNGITYSWDAADGKWVVRTFKANESALEDYVLTDDFIEDQDRQDARIDELSGDVVTRGTYQLVLGVSNEAGKLNVDSSLWGNVTFFQLGLTDLNGDDTPTMSPGDVFRVADPNPQSPSRNEFKITMASHPNYRVEPLSNVGSVGAGYPAIVTFIQKASGLNQRVTEGEAKQDIIEQTISTALDAQSSIQSEQVVQNSQINALETQIQLLSGVKAVGKWTYRRRVESSAPRPPATATFYGTHKDGIDNILLNWSDAYLLMINKTDIDGNNYTFSDFEEGDKVEIIATDGSSAVYGTITNNPSNDVYGNMVIDVERFRSGPIEEKEYLISAYRPGSSNDLIDLDILDQRYLVKTGDTMEAPLNFQRGDKDTTQFKISPNSGSDYATNIYSFYGQMRFRTTHTNNEGDHVGSHIVLSSNGGSPSTKIYHVEEAGENAAVPKSYVDATAGVPVGSIMIWLSSSVPDGWFKLQGANFDINTYPLLHAYLQGTDGYTSGKLPDWKGRYPGEYGDHLAGVSIGKKLAQKTATPSGGAPKSTTQIPDGSTRTFTATGNTNAYSAGLSQVTINSGWDSVTRPPTVVVHYIIKHD